MQGHVEDGHVEDGWGKVADGFRASFDGNPGEVGAACCVYVDGRPVVDLRGGLADREANRPWSKDTIVAVASTTKGATAICAHLLAQRGQLNLDAPMVEYWPELNTVSGDPSFSMRRRAASDDSQEGTAESASQRMRLAMASGCPPRREAPPTWYVETVLSICSGGSRPGAGCGLAAVRLLIG